MNSLACPYWPYKGAKHCALAWLARYLNSESFGKCFHARHSSDSPTAPRSFEPGAFLPSVLGALLGVHSRQCTAFITCSGVPLEITSVHDPDEDSKFMNDTADFVKQHVINGIVASHIDIRNGRLSPRLLTRGH
jgi:hypothetical protein